MGFNKVVRDLVIGSDAFIESKSAYKSAMLRGQLCIVAILACSAYIFVDKINGVSGFEPFYLAGIAVAGVSLWLNRKGKYQAANLIFGLAFNFLIYVFASNDSDQAGVHAYFIVASLMALSLFGYDGRWVGFLFCLLSLGLFVATYIYEIKWVIVNVTDPDHFYSKEYERTSFVFNFMICFAISCFAFYSLVNINHNTEKKMMATNELLTKSNQELDRFVYSASHDLKAPLSSMLGLIEVAQRTEDPEEVKLCLQMMKERVHNLDEFILEIIDYSRNSRLELKKEQFDLGELLKSVVDNLRYADTFDNIYVVYKIPNNLEVVSDKARLKVVLNNLIGNSLKYHDPAKENPLIEISAIKQGNQLMIEIKDNGLGIGKEHQSRIFDMFYRASENSKGSGLGLYIVKETIDKMAGRISVDSQLGGGTRFTLQLPVLWRV
jgi:signal transduction histidine kinase